MTLRMTCRYPRPTSMIRLGEAAAEDYEDAPLEAVFAGLLVAAETGHPDETEARRGIRPRVIWSPHLAVAVGFDPREARTETATQRKTGRAIRVAAAAG